VFMFGLILWALHPSFPFFFPHNWNVLVRCLLVESVENKFILKNRQSVYIYIYIYIYILCRSQWPRGLRRRSAAARLLRLWVRIPPGAWMSVCCGCCVTSDRGLCDELITRPDESYRLWWFIVCM